MDFVFLNNEMVPHEQASVPIDNRGFRFGDGIFETLRIVNGKPYLYDYHLKRLNAGLDALGIIYNSTELEGKLKELITRNGVDDAIARILISRSGPSKGYMPTSNRGFCLIETAELPTPPQDPQSLWLSSIQRSSTHSLPMQAKLTHGINPMLARQEAETNDCFEALMVNSKGAITECSSSCIFWTKGTHLFTPSLECGLVDSVMRRRIIELSPQSVNEGSFTIDDIQHADELFIANVTLGIVPIERLLPHDETFDSSRITADIANLITEDMATNA